MDRPYHNMHSLVGGLSHRGKHIVGQNRSCLLCLGPRAGIFCASAGLLWKFGPLLLLTKINTVAHVSSSMNPKDFIYVIV